MAFSSVSCARCETPLRPAAFNRGWNPRCPGCNGTLRADVFPAFVRPLTGTGAGEKVTASTEASCFFHKDKKAVVPCGTCGRFLCSLCDIELEDRHICPLCMEAGKDKGRIKAFETGRVLYDRVAFSVAVLPLLLFWLTIFTAPIAFYLTVRHWNSPRGVLNRSRVRLVIAGLLSLLQITGWTVLAIFLMGKLMA